MQRWEGFVWLDNWLVARSDSVRDQVKEVGGQGPCHRGPCTLVRCPHLIIVSPFSSASHALLFPKCRSDDFAFHLKNKR